MTRTIDRDVTTLRAAVNGAVLLPGDGDRQWVSCSGGLDVGVAVQDQAF